MALDNTQAIRRYIAHARAAGKSDEVIRDELEHDPTLGDVVSASRVANVPAKAFLDRAAGLASPNAQNPLPMIKQNIQDLPMGLIRGGAEDVQTLANVTGISTPEQSKKVLEQYPPPTTGTGRMASMIPTALAALGGGELFGLPFGIGRAAIARSGVRAAEEAAAARSQALAAGQAPPTRVPSLTTGQKVADSTLAVTKPLAQGAGSMAAAPLPGTTDPNDWLKQIMAGAAIGGVGSFGGRIAGGLVSPSRNLSAEARNNLDVLRQHDISLGVDQVTKGPLSSAVRRVSGQNPIAAAIMGRGHQAEDIDRAVLRSMGAPEEIANRGSVGWDVLGQVEDRLGSRYNEIYKSRPKPLDPQYDDDVLAWYTRNQKDYSGLPAKENADTKELIDHMLSMSGKTLDDLQATRSTYATKAREAYSGANPDYGRGDAYATARDIMDRFMMRNYKDVAPDLPELNRQYAWLKMAQKPGVIQTDSSGTSHIHPGRFNAATRHADVAGYATDPSEMQQFGQAISSIQDKTANSGTAQRLMEMGILGSGSAALVGSQHDGPDFSTMASSAVLPAAMSLLLRSPAGAAYARGGPTRDAAAAALEKTMPDLLPQFMLRYLGSN